MGTFIKFFTGLWFYFSSFLVEIKKLDFSSSPSGEEVSIQLHFDLAFS
jgi:hypothetical protein